MDTRELRNVFGSFVTGVTVVTTVDAQGAYQGVTANSFSSVSLDPPLVLWSQATGARSHPAFRDSDRFIVNILSEHQRELSQRFATSGPDKFAGIATHARQAGLPALPECCAYVECRKVAMYPGGDHVVYLGEVVAVERNDRRPLAFAKGRYMVAFEHELNFTLPEGSADHLAHNEAVRLACAALPELANRLDATMGVGVWGNRGPTLVRWEPGPDRQMPELRTGAVVSPLTSATGLLFGAHLPQDMCEPVLLEALAALQSQGGDVRAARELYRQRVGEVRAAGVAQSAPASLPDMVGLSAPVFDRAGRMVLALCCVAGQSGRAASLTPDLLQAAASLSARLGHRTAPTALAA
ncbi:flavin reductase [Ramlibacter algicola]|uniref:Flavin reductase n=1 Tax=Ramlibacter algicola TaxID=2795217 RepID=A0A934PXW7_9BURK|nr:flavin reductase [Ramlibacter algicola]MBK0392555.1 flavin reductase [Ramlibacter algicola]